MDNINHIYIIPVISQYILYNPLNGRYALIDPDIIGLLKEVFEDKNKKVPAYITDLADFIGAGINEIPEKKGPVNPEFLGIIPSRNCNMACAYCDFGAHQESSQKLDPAVMVNIIDWYADLRIKAGKKTLPVQFFGGEPFIEDALLDIAVHHSRFLCSRTGLIPQFEALSNGYYTEKQRVFIQDYFNHIVISLDGFRKYHDKTRSGINNKSTFNEVIETVKYFSSRDLGLSIRCCITSESVNDMEAIAEWFSKELKPGKVNFEVLTENEYTIQSGLKPPDPYTFAVNCIKSWHILRKYGIEPANASVSLNFPQTTSCPVGRDVVIVHPDGMLASCYLNKNDWISKKMDLSVGKVWDNNVLVEKEKLLGLRGLLNLKTRCQQCFCRYGCAGGCHVNNTFPGASENYVDYCIQTRIITLCSLLDEMGEQNIIDELLDDKSNMEQMNKQISDRLIDFQI